VEFGRVLFEICERTDRQTADTHTRLSQYFAPYRGEVIIIIVIIIDLYQAIRCYAILDIMLSFDFIFIQLLNHYPPFHGAE